MDVQALARAVLGLKDAQDVAPPFIVDALRRHLAIYPTETNFLITMDPRTCGLVTCMEESCFVDLILTQDHSVADGGIARGFGSLEVFQQHCNVPVHRAAHAKRIGAGQKPMKPDPAPAAPWQPKPAAIVDRKPSLALLAELDAADRDRRDVKPVKRNGSFSDNIHSDGSDVADKKPKLNGGANPGVLAQNVNAVNNIAPAAPNENEMTKAKYDKILLESRATELVWRNYRTVLESTAVAQRNHEYYTKLDHANRVGAAIGAAIIAHTTRWGREFGSAAANGMAGAAGGIAGAAVNAFGAAMEAMQQGRAADHDADDEGVAPPTSEEFDEFLKVAAEGKGFEGNDTVDAAVKSLGLKAQGDKIGGMLIPLMAHQLIGVSWMVAQENTKNYGGILADDMGLGKTIQTIAVMAKNQSQDPKEKTNLIVAPLALLQQWKEEIENRMERHYFKILIHHGPTKVKSAKEFHEYDVVLTTYQTLAGEWPDEEVSMKKAKTAAKKAGGDEPDDFLQMKKAGPLFKFSFFRIILDEAQQIRNRQTRVSRSVAQLDALYRWCLTGTPITNSLADVFPLLRFCQIKPFYVWKEFNQAISTHEKKRPDIAGRKCQAVLRTCLMRRKKDSTLAGQPLVVLPTKTVELRVLEFSEEEREIYTFVERRTQATFNKYLKAGTVLKNYAHVLVLLLRLRQLCFHPCLISDGFDALAVETKDLKRREDEVERALKLLGAGGKKFVDNVRRLRLEKAVEAIRAEKEDANAMVDEDDCPICMEPFVDGEAGGIVTKCGHTFCRTCITEVLQKAQADDLAEDEGAPKYKADERPCPNCRGPISEIMIFNLAAFEPTDEEIAEVTGVDLEKQSIDTGKESDSDDEEEEEAPVKTKKKNRAVIEDSDEEEEKKPEKEKMSEKKAGKQKAAKELPGWMAQQEPSTKMRWLLEEIRRIEIEAPDDKFIIISSFTSALDLVDDFLRSHNIPATRYQGDMSRTQRDDSVRILAKSKKCKIMLMSLKCGGVGLNLVRANRVINLDLAWSHAVEAQAFDRCHRLGQVKPVTVDRLTIADSVEQRIGDMQERKKRLAEASLGEGNGEKLGKMTVAELAGLFGLNGRGQRIQN